MTDLSQELDQPLRRTDDVARTRDCLTCRSPFESEWSGERICRRCKSHRSWRSGAPQVFGHPGGR